MAVPVRARDLFEAVAQNQLPLDEGWVVSASFGDGSGPSSYEAVSYAALQGVQPGREGLLFRGTGRKLDALVESPPERGNRIVIAPRALDVSPSFVIPRPRGFGFALVFYKTPDLAGLLSLFFEKTFTHEAGLPPEEAKRAAARFTALLIPENGR